MAIVTSKINTKLNNIDKPWFQILNSLNNLNESTVKDIIAEASLVVYGRFENPSPDYIKRVMVSNCYGRIMKSAVNVSNKLGYNSTQCDSLKARFDFWCNNLFKKVINSIDNGENKIGLIIHNDTIGKVECEFVKALYENGVNVMLITSKDVRSNFCDIDADYIDYKDASKIDIRHIMKDFYSLKLIGRKLEECDDTSINEYESKESSNSLSVNVAKERDILKIVQEELRKIDKLLELIINTDKRIALSVCGRDTFIDVNMLAAKLNESFKNDSKTMFIEHKMQNVCNPEFNMYYNLKGKKADYIIATLSGSVRGYNNIKNILYEELSKLNKTCENTSIFYNRSIAILSKLTEVLKYKQVIFYGIPNTNDSVLLNIVSRLNEINLIVLSSDKSNSFTSEYIENIELSSSSNNCRLEDINTDVVTTLAYEASKRADEILFNGETLGLYKEGTVKSIKSKRLACTYDEIALWWNKEVYLRPGYVQKNFNADVPTIFACVKGVKENVDWKKEIQRYCCGDTKLLYGNNFEFEKEGPVCSNLCNIKNTSFIEQAPLIINGTVQKDEIKNTRDYLYGHLDLNKQDIILSKIQEMIDEPKLRIPKQCSKDDYQNLLLNIALNLDKTTRDSIQQNDFVGPNPNIVVVNNTENTLSFKDCVYLTFMNKLGYDIIIFVPTGYASIDNFTLNGTCETYVVGKSTFELELSGIEVKEDANFINKSSSKKTWFNKLFN